jgi:Protein of unknown function (DUF1572)
MTDQILQNYLDDSIAAFRTYKGLAEKAMAQVSDEQFFQTIDEESNSIAVIAKHIGGNLRSRWTNFLTTDGEKPYRHRDSEFVSGDDTRDSLMEFWENGWQTLFLTLESLQPDDLGAIVKIRGEDHTVVKAMNRSMAHTSSHVGQIIFLAKHLLSGKWKTISIPRNKSVEFNAFLDEQKKGGSKMTFTEWHENFEEKIKREES